MQNKYLIGFEAIRNAYKMCGIVPDGNTGWPCIKAYIIEQYGKDTIAKLRSEGANKKPNKVDGITSLEGVDRIVVAIYNRDTEKLEALYKMSATDYAAQATNLKMALPRFKRLAERVEIDG